LSKTFQEKILVKIQSTRPHYEHQSYPVTRIPIILKGTDFQIQVWRQLAQIPFGKIFSYTQLAQRINRPKAIRAISNAVAKNPIAILIPCHRIIRKNGMFGNYRWGKNKKLHLINWESSQNKQLDFYSN
tara:strand:+ start:84 stop:470 length:387 start_codon:yes stop_codon:yes gene_type:complete